jgi:hypothetical protein
MAGPLRFLAVAASCALLTGCDPDTAVFVEATIEGGSLQMTQSALSTGVSGGFILRLHLADRASDSSEVSVLGFSLLGFEVTVIDPLAAIADTPPPYEVPVGGDVVVLYALTAEDNLLENTLVDALCHPTGAIIQGAVDDSLRGQNVDVRSSPILNVSGCP